MDIVLSNTWIPTQSEQKVSSGSNMDTILLNDNFQPNRKVRLLLNHIDHDLGSVIKTFLFIS